jgi:dihydroorotate dehydrogenase
LYGSPELPVNLFGFDFPNPLGIAAGLDKNGEAVPAWQSIGFGKSNPKRFTGNSGEPYKLPVNDIKRRERLVTEREEIRRL